MQFGLIQLVHGLGRQRTEGWVSATSVIRLAGGPRGFVMLALLAAAVCWSFGLLLAPDRKRFFSSPEWHFQPFYLAVHIAALQLFMIVYKRNFNAGISHLDVGPGQPAGELTRVLSPWAYALAVVIAAPFAFYDLLYLYSDRYEKMSGDGTVKPIDLLMWCIWSTEWYLNALIWLVLLGFLIKTCWVIQRYRFKSPIEVVLHERQYRPLLRMSAQGATVLVGFSFATVAYIWYTGGEITDYAGLAITGLLLVVGFVTPWLLLQGKVNRLVHHEMLSLRRQLALDMHRGREAGNAEGEEPAMRALEHRLDVVVSMLRITYLEQRHDKVGQTEARAVMLRMLAPILTIAWQFRQHSAETLQSFMAVLHGFIGRLGGIGG